MIPIISAVIARRRKQQKIDNEFQSERYQELNSDNDRSSESQKNREDRIKDSTSKEE